MPTLARTAAPRDRAAGRPAARRSARGGASARPRVEAPAISAGNLAVQRRARAQQGGPCGATHPAEAAPALPLPVSTAATALVQRCGCGCGGGPGCAEEQVQRKERAAGAPSRASTSIPAHGGGSRLDRGTRGFMESRFGRDFGGVRVHTDAAAADSARGLDARAYTVGQDVYFGSGEYRPETREGRRLLAHELTHTVQQAGARRSPQAALRVSRPGDALEREADRVAARVVDGAGAAGAIASAPGAGVQRYELPSWDDVEAGADALAGAAGEGLDWAGEKVEAGAEWAGEQVEAGAEWAGEKVDAAVEAGSEALDWLTTEAGAAALAGAQALVAMWGGTVRIRGLCIEVEIPSIPLFPSFNKTLGRTPEYAMYVPFLTGGALIGGIPVAGTVGFLATAQGSAEAAVGPGMIHKIKVVICPLSGTATGTAELYAAAAIAPRLTLFGGLAGAVLTVLPTVPPIPVMVILQGGLRGIITGWLIGAIRNTVTLSYAIGGGLSFRNVTDLMGGVLLQGDLDLYAALRLYDKVICDYAYRLGHWETGAAWQLTIPITASLGGGAGGSLGVGPITWGSIPVGSIVTAIKPPPTGLNCLSWQEIKQFLCENGIFPEEWCVEEEDDDGTGPLRNVLAVAICKCVGETKCGAGIYKKCFTVSDKTCKNRGKMQKLADDCCNHDSDIQARCQRSGGCRIRHTDFKCPVKDSECTHGHCDTGTAAGASACTITTQTLVSAPDGTADTRRKVGVNERVEMTASASATWKASCGTLSPTTGLSVVWTAPERAGSCRVTATPSAGTPCSVTMKVVAPSRRALTKRSDRAYSAGLAGSGFVADVVIMPLNVSFTRTQVREDKVKAKASGYYKDVLGWDGIEHPVGRWLTPDASNSGIIDTIGTNPPGTPTPFKAGRFEWPIPQAHRRAGGSGSGSVYSTGRHVQRMKDTSGEETTSKEGASRTRTP